MAEEERCTHHRWRDMCDLSLNGTGVCNKDRCPTWRTMVAMEALLDVFAGADIEIEAPRKKKKPNRDPRIKQGYHRRKSVTKTTINSALCGGCHVCVDICPMNVYKENSMLKQPYTVPVPENQDKCILCMACVNACPNEAIEKISIS